MKYRLEITEKNGHKMTLQSFNLKRLKNITVDFIIDRPDTEWVILHVKNYVRYEDGSFARDSEGNRIEVAEIIEASENWLPF